MGKTIITNENDLEYDWDNILSHFKMNIRHNIIGDR